LIAQRPNKKARLRQALVEPSKLQEEFQKLYGSRARIFRAPGRVNLIGEHTDYNDGFVMPSAIDFAVWIAISPRADRKLVIHSNNFCQTAEIDLQNGVRRPQKHWSGYIQGVAVMFEKTGCHLQGANLLVDGNVPIGSGLSSSAAIEVASAFAFLANSGLSMDRVEIAKLCRRAENEFVGVRVGIMDQFVSCCGRAGQTLMLDCRSLDSYLLPLPRDVSLVICNTMVKHELGTGEYNKRREQCEEGVRILSRSLPQVRALRDLSLDELEQNRSQLTDIVYRRCRHVISENARVQQAAAALKREDLHEFGRLMGESHCSLRDDYEVSCPELDVMVELANKQKGVYGARMTGGGFGGCTINLVHSDAVAEFKKGVSEKYEKATGLSPQIFVSSAAEGAGEVH
jgi:galactokinase